MEGDNFHKMMVLMPRRQAHLCPRDKHIFPSIKETGSSVFPPPPGEASLANSPKLKHYTTKCRTKV